MPLPIHHKKPAAAKHARQTRAGAEAPFQPISGALESITKKKDITGLENAFHKGLPKAPSCA